MYIQGTRGKSNETTHISQYMLMSAMLSSISYNYYMGICDDPKLVNTTIGNALIKSSEFVHINSKKS